MVFLLSVLFITCAASFIIAKAVLSYTTPFFFVGVRMIFAGLLLLGYCWYKGSIVSIKKKDYALFAGIILFHIYVMYMTDLWAMQYLSAAKTAFIYSLSPFITAIVSYFWFSEIVTVKKIIGLAIGFAGMMPELMESAPQEKSLLALAFISWPEIVMIVSVFSSVIGWTFVRELVTAGAYSPLYVNGFAMFGGGILALITSYFVEGWSLFNLPITNTMSFIYLTLLIILLCNLIFYNLYGHLLRYYTATFLSFAGFTIPLLTALLGWIFLGETVSWHFYLSVFLVSIGLYVFYQEELRQGYIKA